MMISQKLVPLLDEEDALDSNSGIRICHIVIRGKMANKEGKHGKELSFGEL